MVRAGGRGGRKSAAVKYTEDPDSGSDDEVMQASNGKKRAKDSDSDYEDGIEDEEEVRQKPRASPKKKSKAAPPVVYKDASSDSDIADAGEMEGEDSDYDVKKSAKKNTKKTPAKKKSPKKSTKKGRPVAVSSRSRGRSTKTAKYADGDSDDDEEEEEETVPVPRKAGRGRPPAKQAPKQANRQAKKSKVVYLSEDEEPESESEPEYNSEDELPMKKGRGRQAASNKTSQQSKLIVSEMVPNAIRKLNENPRKGSSLAAIKSFMRDEWGIEIKPTIATKIKNFILNAVEDGDLIQTKGKGANGRFTVKGMKRKVKKRRKKVVVSDDEGAVDEAEYNPVKSARDEERERELIEKEERRLARQEAELRKEIEKASRPKKEYVRKTEWEVEYIKAMKVVADKAWYQVKFENWKKLSWEPEENLTGCQDVIDNFMLEEKVRVAEEEEKRRREEDEGKYEVGRILEVKFLKNGSREFMIRWKGHGEDLDSWEPEDNLDCPDLIDKFMKKHEKRLEATEKNLRVAPKRVERLQFANSHRVGKRNQGFRATYVGMDSDGDY